jgi:hypothetical protein
MTDSTPARGAPVIIKKYDDRFYDTERNTYINLDELGRRVRDDQAFTVVDAKNGEDLTERVLAKINALADATHEMRTLIRAGKLPYDLLDHHWFRGTTKEIGPHEILIGGGCDHFPVDSIKVFDEIPATLAMKDYSRARVTERFQRSKQRAIAKDQAKINAGKKGNDHLEGLTEDYGLDIEIDGIKCRLHDTWLDEGIPHKKIIDAVLKPRSYTNVKGDKNTYQKRLSETEFLSCRFGIHALWGQIRELRASMGYHCGDLEIHFPLIYWGAFNWVEWMKIENMNAMTITTERIFTMAVENIAFLLTTLEANFLERWRTLASG